MKNFIDKVKFRFYIRLAVAFLLLNLVGSLIDSPETFAKRIVNHIWLILFLVPLNYILFEYTIPSIKLSFKRILIGLLLIWIHLLFYSFGLYAWRNAGIYTGIYFDLKAFKPMEGVSFFMGYSMASIFFFGIIRHIYNYIKLKQATTLSGYYYYEVKIPKKDIAFIKLSWVSVNGSTAIRIDCFDNWSKYAVKLDCPK